MLRSLLVSTTVVLGSLAPGLDAQATASPRIHPYLADRLAKADAKERLPVYFVVADRLGYDHWFPRVNRMRIDERRAVVVAELRAHAARTQKPLLDRLRRWEEQGQVAGIFSNWLGNFVQCKATPGAIADVGSLAALEEVRYDAAWPVHRVQDGSVAHATATTTTPGNGAINSRADQVWELGFTGQGVVVMNADSGINVQHGDLVNRLWTNPGEIPGNGIDDDHNGYVDDVYGWNFFDDNNNIDDGGGHGTITAGVLVGDGFCSGTVTGQAPDARVMTGKLGACCPQNGPVNPAGEVAQWDGIQYAIQMGAHVQTSSHSFKNGFVPPPNYKMHREVGDNSLAAGLIRTNSTSNNGNECNNPTHLARRPFNVSSPGNLPPPYLDPNQTLVGRKSGVIGVGAHDVNSNQLESYSPCGPFAWFLPDLLLVNPSYPTANWTELMNDYPWQGGEHLGLLKPDVTGPTNGTTTMGGGITCSVGPSGGTSNATPRVAGCMILWKSANMSLKPEDTAMIVHQSATSTGAFPGKENGWGAGRVDALAGLYLALCTHRVNGEPAWSVDHKVGTALTWEVDTVPNTVTALVFGTQRTATSTGGGVLGIGGQVAVAFVGNSGATGEVSISAVIPASLLGLKLYTQWFTDDLGGATGLLLSSNVIETAFVP